MSLELNIGRSFELSLSLTSALLHVGKFGAFLGTHRVATGQPFWQVWPVAGRSKCFNVVLGPLHLVVEWSKQEAAVAA